MAFRDCPGLVQYDNIHFLRDLKAGSILDEYPVFRPFADPDRDGCRCCQSQGARAGNDEYCNHGQKSVDEPLFRSEYPPAGKDKDSYADYDWYEYPGDLVHKLLYGRLAPLGIIDHPDDLRQDSILPGLLRYEYKRPFLVYGAGIYLVSCGFECRHRLPGEHTFIYVGFSFADRSIQCHPFSGLDDDVVSWHGLFDRDRHLREFILCRCSCATCISRLPEYGHRGRLQSGEFPDRSGSLSLRPFFKQPSDEDECNDYACSLEIQVRLDASGKPEPGEEQVEQAEQIGDAGTDSHQCVHIRGPVFHLFPGIDIESSSENEDSRRSQCA